MRSIRKILPDYEVFFFIQAHQDYFADEGKHKILSIQVYSLKPNFYKRETCDTHKKEYAICCENCFDLACSECNNHFCLAKSNKDLLNGYSLNYPAGMSVTAKNSLKYYLYNLTYRSREN